jgi:hypothetical protein
MTDQAERREHIERARAIRRVRHLIESGYLPNNLADDLQRLIDEALMWEMGDTLNHNHMLRAFTDAQLSRHHELEALSPDELRQLVDDMADAIHLLEFGKELVKKQRWLSCPPGPFEPIKPPPPPDDEAEQQAWLNREGGWRWKQRQKQRQKQQGRA